MGVERQVTNVPRKPRDEGQKKKAREPSREERREELIDRILADSFPASDPPPWTMGRRKQR